jgi:hypothetical protein
MIWFSVKYYVNNWSGKIANNFRKEISEEERVY